MINSNSLSTLAASVGWQQDSQFDEHLTRCRRVIVRQWNEAYLKCGAVRHIQSGRNCEQHSGRFVEMQRLIVYGSSDVVHHLQEDGDASL